jgi:Cytochrome P460
MAPMRAALVGLLALGAVSLLGFTFGSGGKSEPSSAPSGRAPFPGVPAYIAGYKRWPKHNRRPIPPRASDPHDSQKNIYVSKPLKRGQKRYGVGTIIVKEGREPGTKFVKLVAVMRKIRGFNRQHNDWQFIEWSRQSRDSRFTEVARGTVCYSCHVGARARDYVWFKRRR